MDGLILISGYLVGGSAGLIGGSIFTYFYLTSPYRLNSQESHFLAVDELA